MILFIRSHPQWSYWHWHSPSWFSVRSQPMEIKADVSALLKWARLANVAERHRLAGRVLRFDHAARLPASTGARYI
jgi:hypothetical protein